MRIAQDPHSGNRKVTEIRLGVLCGLEREACVLRDALPQGHHEIRCSGAIADQAVRAASDLAACGATHLLSFGLAGALDPSLSPGDLLLPTRVSTIDGACRDVDAEWHNALCHAVPEARDEPLLGIDHAAETIDRKRALHQLRLGTSVDMESHILARQATRSGLPFVVVRAVADDAETVLPPAAMVGVGPDGRERPFRVLADLLRQPRQLPDLIRLARASGKGLRSLGRVAGLVMPI